MGALAAALLLPALPPALGIGLALSARPAVAAAAAAAVAAAAAAGGSGSGCGGPPAPAPLAPPPSQLRFSSVDAAVACAHLLRALRSASDGEVLALGGGGGGGEPCASNALGVWPSVATLLALGSSGGCGCTPAQVARALGAFAQRLARLGLGREAALVQAVAPAG
jgi:hypothetical protein